MEDLYLYKNDQFCAHCMWILEKPPNVYYIPKILNYIPIGTYNIEDKGCTIFQSTDKFRYAFNCVYGYKENIPNLNHSTSDFSTLIKCADWFIVDMHKKLGIEKFRLMVNSKTDKRYGEKEHLHTIITLDFQPDKFNTRDCKKFDKFFNTEKGFSRQSGNKKQMDRDFELYGDNIIDIDNKTCKKLIKTDDFSEFMNDKFDLDTEKDFYLSLYFSFKKNEKPKITGKLSF